MKKDKSVTVRINSVIKEQIDKRGLSVQRILDKWIADNYEVKVKIVKNKKK